MSPMSATMSRATTAAPNAIAIASRLMRMTRGSTSDDWRGAWMASRAGPSDGATGIPSVVAPATTSGSGRGFSIGPNIIASPPAPGCGRARGPRGRDLGQLRPDRRQVRLRHLRIHGGEVLVDRLLHRAQLGLELAVEHVVHLDILRRGLRIRRGHRVVERAELIVQSDRIVQHVLPRAVLHGVELLFHRAELLLEAGAELLVVHLGAAIRQLRLDLADRRHAVVRGGYV